MRQSTLPLASIATGGALLGASMAASWIEAISRLRSGLAPVPDFLASHHAAAGTAEVLLLIAATVLILRSLFPQCEGLVLAVTALLSGAFAPNLVAAAVRALTQTSPRPIEWIALAALPILFKARITHLPRHIAAGAILAVAPICVAQPIPLTCPPDLVRIATAYAPMPSLQSYWATVLPFLAGGCLAAVFVAYLIGTPIPRGAAIGAVVGTGLGLLVALSHALALLTAMQTGWSWTAITVTLITLWMCLAIAVSICHRAWVSPSSSTLARLAPVPICAVAAAHIVVLTLGASSYHSLSRFHSDHQYTYIHFRPDGTWQRTFDHAGSATKLWRCERFLATYPHSAYYPAALLQLAECKYELWDFPGAAEALAELSRRYPAFRGYPDILRACTLSASGDDRQLLRLTMHQPRVAQWARAEGALLAAAAADRASVPGRALGFYNSYIEFLRSRQPTAWSRTTLSFATAGADDALDRARNGRTPLGSVRIRVLADGRPLSRARIVLVRPHPDAAFPTDSRQFTGAWTIPAWNGIWGDTDLRGYVTLTNVPYGHYSIVLGLDFSTARQGYVVTSCVPPVTVDSGFTTITPIRLVRSVELHSPRPAESVSDCPRLTWEAVPAAVAYAVSVVVLDEPASHSRTRSGQTCWAKAGITTTTVEVTPEHFMNGHSRLEKGGSYMWIVYAVGKDGRLVSSSEHYAQLHEPAFSVR